MNHWWRRSRPRAARLPVVRYRPCLEALEDRWLPAVLTVFSPADMGPGTLRQAVLDANNEALYPGPDTIVFAPTLAGTTISLRTVDTTSLTDPTSGNSFILGPSAFRITSPIAIDGGSGGVTLARDPHAPDFRIFQVFNPASPASANLTLRNLTVSGGLARGGTGGDGGGGGGGAAGLGGAILNLGALTINGVTFTGNQAVGGDGGNSIPSDSVDFSFRGGGGGGGLGGDGQSGSVFGQPRSAPGGPPNGGSSEGQGLNGQNGGGGGGGPQGQGPGGDSISALGLGGGGGGGATEPGSSRGGNGDFGGGGGGGGGSVYFDTAGGSSLFGGGAGGAGSSGRQGTGAGSPGSAGGGGGGAGLGGALFNHGTLTITNSTFDGNSAIGGAGGLDTASNPSGDNGAGLGGAVFTWDSSATIVNSTLADNTVSTDGQDVYNLQLAFSTNPDLVGTQNPPSENGFPPSQPSSPPATLKLVNTIVDYEANAGPVDLVNAGGTITGSNNFVASQRGVPAAVILSSADPLIGPLQDNGGPTPTRELLANSPALNTGSTAGAPGTDQRGVPRGAAINVGAYQATPNSLMVSGFPDPQTAGVPGTFTVTASPVDAFGKTVRAYSGPVTFSATGQSTVPDPASLPGGTGTFRATLSTPGSQTLTATDPALGISGAQTVTVVAAAMPVPPPPAAPVPQPPAAPAPPPAAPSAPPTPPTDSGNTTNQQTAAISLAMSRAAPSPPPVQDGIISRSAADAVAISATVGGVQALDQVFSGPTEFQRATGGILADLPAPAPPGNESAVPTAPAFDAALGIAYAGDTGQSRPLTAAVAEAGLGGRVTPIGRILETAGGKENPPLLLFQLESKPLRIGSSLADADDSVLLVETVAGRAAAKPVAAADPRGDDPAPAVQAVPVKQAHPGRLSGSPPWLAAGGLVVGAVVWGLRFALPGQRQHRLARTLARPRETQAGR